MVVTEGKSRPRAATSVLSSTPASHLVKSRKVAVRTLCTGEAAEFGQGVYQDDDNPMHAQRRSPGLR